MGRRNFLKGKNAVPIAVVVTVVAFSLILIGAFLVLQPRPLAFIWSDVGSDEEGFNWKMDNSVVVYDTDGNPINVRINPLLPGTVYIWDEALGEKVEVGSIGLRFEFEVSGPEATLDWDTIHFEVSFSVDLAYQGAPIYDLGTETVDQLKTGVVEKEVTIQYLDSIGFFDGLIHYDYSFRFYFEYKATIQKYDGELIESKHYSQTLKFDFEYEPDGIIITGTPTLESNP